MVILKCRVTSVKLLKFRKESMRQERNMSLPAVQAVAYCDKLFSYEREYKEKVLSYKQRYNRRLKNAKPVIEAFLTWLDTQHAGDNAKAHNLKTYDCLKFVLESRPSESMTDEELEAIAPWSEAAQSACGKTQE